MTSSCEILVVGGGPAGATAAALLARAGLDVLVVDRARFPRTKLCAGLLTWKTLRLLAEIFGLQPADMQSSGIVHATSRTYAVHGRCGELLRGELAFPFHFADRSALDEKLISLAASHGARLRMGDPVVGLDRQDRGAVTRSGALLRANLILGADGARSRVRTCLERRGHLSATHWRRGLATALEIRLPQQVAQKAALPPWPAIYLGCIPWGYAWSFPGAAGPGLGICGLNRRAAPLFRDYFARFLSRRGLSPSLSATARAHPLPFGNHLRQPGWNRVLLIGDACGMADPLLGEGIYYAMASGRLAAEAVLRCRSRPLHALVIYRRELARGPQRELRHLGLMRALIYGPLRLGDHASLAAILRHARIAVEETIQGQRPVHRWGWPWRRFASGGFAKKPGSPTLST